MPKREKLLAELSADEDYGIFLAIQMDAVPETLQLIVATARYDAAAGGLRERGQYVIRALGVVEHQVSVGMFARLQFVDEHPLLYQYNTPTVAMFFRGQPDNVYELVLDLEQAHVSTFGLWRDLPEYLNLSKPLVTLLNSGGDLLGQMPKPLAERMAKVLEHHGLEVKLGEAEFEAADEHGRSQLRKALMIDDSYVMALDFSVEELGRV